MSNQAELEEMSEFCQGLRLFLANDPFDTIIKSVFLLKAGGFPNCRGIIPGSKHPPFAIAKSIIAYRIIKIANI